MKYTTEEERKEAKRQYYKQWKEDNPNYSKEYRKTPMGRAVYLINDYKRNDKLYNRGECTLTAKWIVDNIFTKPCAHCGKSGWQIIGCNRLDNSRPHTEDNVEPCCMECNVEEIHPQKKLLQIDKETGEIVHIWESTMEARRGGFIHASCVANGRRKQDKGYIFKFM